MFAFFGKIIKWLVLLLVCSIASFFLLNQFDQSLQPGAAALLRTAPSQVPVQQNAYFTLIGLRAPSDVSPAEWGMKLANNAVTETTAETDKAVCDLEQQHCLRLARVSPEILRAALARESLLQSRYLAARQFPAFEEVLESDAMPNFSAAFRAQSLRHAQIALWLEAGKIAPLTAELQADMAFQRRGLRGVHSLVGKMVLLSALQRDYVLLADLLRAHPERMAAQRAQVMAMLQPLAAEEQEMLSVVRAEFRGLAGLVNALRHQSFPAGLGASPTWLAALKGYVFLPKATINRLYAFEQADEILASASARQFATTQQQMADRQADLARRSWRDIYNPLGLDVIALARVDYQHYLRRPLELNLFIQMLLLQQQLLEQHVLEANIAGFLAQSALRNPFNGDAIGWDAQRHELFIELERAAIQQTRFGYGRGRIAVPLS